ncbi:MAG: isoprenylcysteine carboxylmethyltransferase family protein [Rhodothermaceae bacterium]
MDPINLFVGINIIATFIAQAKASKNQLKLSLSNTVNKPASFLQKLPLNIAAIILLVSIISVFGVLSLTPEQFAEFSSVNYDAFRLAGLLMFVIFSWGQIQSFKTLGKNYTQDVAIIKNHKLVTTGIYKNIRHPQYLCQIFADLGIGLALMSYIIVPVVVLIEIPLIIMRASFEEKLLLKHFDEDYSEYKKKSGFIIPFIG